MPRLVPDELDEPEGLDGLGLALQHERVDRFDPSCVTDEHARRGTDERLAGCRRLFEPGGDVDCVTRYECLAAPTDDHLSRVDTDPGLEAVVGDRVTHLACRPHGPQRIVLVRRRNAEHRHHRVPDELLHRAAVALDDRA